MERIKRSVTPSGVEFSVRNLIGRDQNLLSKAQDDSDSDSLNKMLYGCLRSLGAKSETEITEDDVTRMLSNDRKFILVTVREHTLNYQPLFKFNFEWPLREGAKEKELIPYEVKFSPENFPVRPYYWVADKIKQMQLKDPEFKADGHLILFPVMYETYAQMLQERSIVEGVFPEGQKYRWRMLTGEIEKKYAKVKAVINTTLDMRAVQTPFVDPSDPEKKTQWSVYDTDRADILELEHLRTEIREKEGNVDTSLTIQHPDGIRSVRVDLISLPVFFFPSQAL